MSYINIEERNRKKRTFIMMYAASMLVVIIICTAFLIPSPNLGDVAATGNNNSLSPAANNAQSNDGNEIMQGLVIQIDSLETQMKIREDKISQLEQQLVVAQTSEATLPKEETKVEPRSSPTVSTNNAELRLLKKENDKLKAQVKALQDYVQQ